MEEFQEILTLIEQSYFFKVLQLSAWGTLILSWLGMISFTLKDARKRYFKKSLQFSVVFLPFLLHLVGFLTYLFIRPSQTRAEKIYEKELLELKNDSLLSCPYCGAEIKEDFVFCPRCGKELFDHCENCGKPIKKDWKYCPYCRKEL